MSLSILDKLYPIRCTHNIWLCGILSFITGTISAFSMPPWNIWPLLFIGLSTLYLFLVNLSSSKKIIFTTWCYFFGYFLVSLSWIGNALLVEGNEYRFIWPLAVCGLPAMLSLFPALTIYLSYKLIGLKSFAGYIAFVIALSISEWLRGHLFSGFPWNLVAYSWSDIQEMVQVIAFGGIYLLSLFTIFWAGFLGFLLSDRHNVKTVLYSCLLTAVSLSTVIAFGIIRLDSSKSTAAEHSVYISIIQANIKQEDKWNSFKASENLRQHIKLSSQAIQSLPANSTAIVVWPETAVTQNIIEHPVAAEEIKQFLNIDKTKTVYLMTGILRYEAKENKTKYFNSLVLYDSQLSPVSIYNKSHLVPFGEYIPFKSFIPLKPIVEFNGFEKGTGQRTISKNNLPSYSPLVCYEIIFPGQVVDHNNPEWIVNVTNDAWYGVSAGPYQHYAMAHYRAIEEGMPVVRAANTGISALIDPYGRPLFKSNIFEQNQTSVKLPKKLPNKTYYSSYKDLIYFIIISVMSLFVIIVRKYH